MSSTKQSAEREFAQENADKQFSDKVQDRLSASATDCYLVSADGTRYPVHKTKLQEQSKVLRGTLSDDVASTTELPLDDDAATLHLLISCMYDPYSHVSCTTIQPLLELARKYDVEDIRLQCERFLDTDPLSTSNVPHYMDVAIAFTIPSLIERCKDYIATAENFKHLIRFHGKDWCKKLPGDVAVDVMCRGLHHFICQLSHLQSPVVAAAPGIKLALGRLEEDMNEWLDSFSRSDEWRCDMYSISTI